MHCIVIGPHSYDVSLRASEQEEQLKPELAATQLKDQQLSDVSMKMPSYKEKYKQQQKELKIVQQEG